MAMRRPVRALALAAALLWCLFLYRVVRAPSSVQGPGERYVNFERDPNLDRRWPPARARTRLSPSPPSYPFPPFPVLLG